MYQRGCSVKKRIHTTTTKMDPQIQNTRTLPIKSICLDAMAISTFQNELRIGPTQDIFIRYREQIISQL